MTYTISVKKKSPIHTLWRKQNLYKARLQDVLFTYNKQTGEYSAVGAFENIGALMKNPSLIVTLSGEPLGEVTVGASIAEVPTLGIEPSVSISVTFEKAPKSKKKKGILSRDAEE